MNYETISQLSNAFTVQDIMITSTQLKRADTFENASKLFNEYDVVPFPRAGEIRGSFQRDINTRNSILRSNLISNATSLFELPHLLSKNYFFFILSANKITGYIHYSDLNNMIVKIPFFAMFQAVERRLWDQIKFRIKESDLIRLFEPNEVKKFINKKERAIRQNVDVYWTGVFSFPYILKLSRYYGLIQLTDNEIKLLKDVRNLVAHSDCNLVSQYRNVDELSDACDLFKTIIRS